MNITFRQAGIHQICLQTFVEKGTVLLNSFQHLTKLETLKQVQGDRKGFFLEAL
jgi:hypothetical protein